MKIRRVLHSTNDDLGSEIVPASLKLGGEFVVTRNHVTRKRSGLRSAATYELARLYFPSAAFGRMPVVQIRPVEKVVRIHGGHEDGDLLLLPQVEEKVAHIGLVHGGEQTLRHHALRAYLRAAHVASLHRDDVASECAKRDG